MFEAIEYYQSLAEKFDSRILFVPGIVVVVVGLCIWLAGLRWRKVLGAMAGGCFLAGIGLCIGNYGLPVIAAVTLIGIALGALVEKIMLGIFGTALAAAVVITAASTIVEQRYETSNNYPRWLENEADDAVINFPQAIAVTKGTGHYILSGIIENVKSSLVSVASASTAILITGFAAMMLPRIFIAAVSSSFGSAVIFAGMIMLLFYKGSKPVNFISDKGSYYSMVIFAMIIFGTIVQLVLSPEPKTQKAEPEKNGNKK